MSHPRPNLAIVDDPALGDVVRRLFIRARQLGASTEEAEDLVQDTVERVVRDPEWFDRDRASLYTALATILRNRWIDRIRRRGVRQRLAPKLAIVPPAPTPDLHSLADRAQDRRRLFLASLEPEERQLFRAWILQRRRELTGAQAAASLDLTPAAYEAAKKRLRRRCHRILEELGHDPGDLFDPPGVRP